MYSWSKFVGADVRAENLPRFDDIVRFGKAHRSELPIWSQQMNIQEQLTMTRFLQPMYDVLSRHLVVKLIELALVHDIRSHRQNNPGYSGPRRFTSLVACYGEVECSTQLVIDYDLAIVNITGQGSGEAILGHSKAYESPFWLVHPSDPDAKDSPTLDSPNTIARIREFDFSTARTHDLSAPESIPKRLMHDLRERHPNLRKCGFILFPFLRPTVTDINDPGEPFRSEIYDAPGGILFVLCEPRNPETELKSAAFDAAWPIHYLVRQSLLLESRDERKAAFRQDAAILFHTMLKFTNELEGEAKIALQRDHAVTQGLTRLKRLAQVMKDAYATRRKDSPKYDWRAVHPMSCRDLVSQLSSLIASNFKGTFRVRCDPSWSDSSRILMQPPLLELLIPEIASNAAKYGYFPHNFPFTCQLSISDDGWIMAEFQNPLPVDREPKSLEQVIDKRDGYLGFLQISFACEAFGAPRAEMPPLFEHFEHGWVFSLKVAIARKAN